MSRARLPAVLHAPLRLVRTMALVALEPFDAAHRRLVGQRGLPPLWLRRHVGPLGGFDRAAGEVGATIALLELVRPGDRVLDMGCGVGAMVPDFRRAIGLQGAYIGFDVHAQAIAWARRHWATDPRITFVLAPVRTAFSSGAAGAVAGYRFPTGDASVDFALAKSLFTHLVEDEAAHYFRELRRVLKPGARALVSAFLLDEQTGTREGPPPAYDFAFGGERARWLVEHRPAAGIAFRRAVFLDLCAAAGLRVDRVIEGYWRGGSGAAPNAQDLLVLSRPA